MSNEDLAKQIYRAWYLVDPTPNQTEWMEGYDYAMNQVMHTLGIDISKKKEGWTREIVDSFKSPNERPV